MFTKAGPTIFLFLAIVCYSWVMYLGGSFRLRKVIRDGTHNSVSVSVHWTDWDKRVEAVVESNTIAPHLGERLAEITSISARSTIKYAYSGKVVFSYSDGSSFSVDCFQPNIVRVNGRYYCFSSDLFAVAKAACEASQETENTK